MSPPKTSKPPGPPDLLPPKPGALPDTEFHALQSTLTETEWRFSGRRNRAFLLEAGKGRLKVAQTETELAGPCLIWLPTGQEAVMALKTGARGLSLAVSDVALGRAMPMGPLFARIRHIVYRPLLGVPVSVAAQKRLAGSFSAIEGELTGNAPGAEDAVRYHIGLALIELWRLSSPDPVGQRPSQRMILHNFLQLVDLHMREHWTLARYARQLGISTERLSSAVRRATGQPPLKLVHARLMREAERLLDGPELQIAEIAETLGFRDAGYFNRFFKRNKGMAPGQYRRAQARRPGVAGPTFADWP